MRKRSAADPVRREHDLQPVDTTAPNGPDRPRCFNAVWQGNRVALLTRDGARVTRKDVPAEYSAFVRAEQFEPHAREVQSSSRVRGVKREGDWYRIRFSSYDDRKAVCAPERGVGSSIMGRNGLDCFEADLNPVKRWLADNDVEIQKPLRCYLDIETDSRVPFSQKSRARILCWAIVCAQTGRRVLGMLQEDTDEAEKELLEDLWYELQDYDQVAAWSGGEFKEDAERGFDFPMIATRTKRHGIHVDARRWLWVDHLELFRKFNISASESGDEKASMSLDSVSKKILGEDEGKLDGVDGSMSWELWERGGEDRALLGRYCVRDTTRLDLIEKKTGFFELLDAVSEACGTFPDNYGMKGVNYVEAFLLRLGRRRGYHFPSNWRDRGKDKFDGAYVMEPTETGILRNVHVCDFAGMYPSIIQTWNMSIDTHAPEYKVRAAELRPAYLAHLPANALQNVRPANTCLVPITGEVFRTDFEGILVEAVNEIRRLRKYWDDLKKTFPPGSREWKEADRRAAAYKIVANTFYGVIGSVFSRAYKREVGESVTQAGVWLIKQTIREATQRAIRGVYGDTDSVFCVGTTEDEFRRFMGELNDTVFPALLKAQGCQRNEIRIEYEKEFEILILVGKKRYAGRFRHFKGKRATADSKPEIKGLEYKRGDTARMCREFQRRVIEDLLAGNESVEHFVQLVKGERDRVLDGELDSADFVMSKKLKGSIESYAVRKKNDGEDAAANIHVQVAKRMRELGMDVSEGTRVQYVVTDASENLKAVPLCEYEPGSEDRYYLWEKLVYPATQRVLEACFKTHDWRLYARARPPKPKKGKPVLPGQTAFNFENPGSQLAAAASPEHEITQRRSEDESSRHRRGPDGRRGYQRTGAAIPGQDRTSGRGSDRGPEAPQSLDDRSGRVDPAPDDQQGRVEERSVRRRSRSAAGGA